MFERNKIFSLIILVLLVIPAVVLAQTTSSTNYSVEGGTFDSGGEPSSSTNYKSTDSIGDVETGSSSSTNYKTTPGFEPIAYPGIPGTPTLTNTGGTLYNSLDFIVSTGPGQQSDTTYAIAISKDNFVTTFFIQNDDTVGSVEAWQSYSGWNSGTGERVTGLDPSTTYKIKVKASYGSGSNGADSESGYSSIASATTSAPSLIATISGVSTGVCVENSGGSCPPGYTTTVTSTSTAMGYGSLTVGDANPNIAAQTVTVTTNATGGYTTTVRQNHDLTNDTSNTIIGVTGSNSSPAAFNTGVTRGWFGYHTTDSALCTGTSGRFAASNDRFAALTTSPLEVACNTVPVTSEVTSMVFKLVIGTIQENGNYQNVITYITTATY